MNWEQFLETSLDSHTRPNLPDDIKLPMLPHAITQFAQKANDPDASAKELAAVIEVDSGLSAELLRHANSSVVGLRNKSTSVQQTLGLLGIRNCKMFLLTRGLRGTLQSRDAKVIDLKVFWNANLERALFSREVAGMLRADRDVAFAGAMLQDLMLPVLTTHHEDAYTKFLADESAGDLVEFEENEFNFNHAVAAAYVMKDWGFPADLISCVMHHHRGTEILDDAELGKTAVAASALSSLLPNGMKQVTGGIEQLDEIGSKIPGFNLASIAARVDEGFGELSDQNSGKRMSLVERCEPAAVAG